MTSVEIEVMDEKTEAEMAQHGEAMGSKNDENVERGNWTGKADFLLSCIGYAVGLGNVWRFPYLCFQNGGGAFLIPYAIMLTIAGLPLFFMELSFGQFANLGPISIWRVAPLFQGVGYAMVIISGLVSIYYNVIIGWSLYYMFASFTSKLPWQDCSFNWNDETCRNKFLNVSQNGNVPGNPRWNPFPDDCVGKNRTNCTVYQTPAEQYWERVVLGMTSWNGSVRTLDEGIGDPQWHITLCLLLAWILVFSCLVNGVKSSGKVVYFTAIFPYVVLIILFIRGLTLEGSATGIYFYITPKWSTLADAKVWGDAAVQIFYSLGVAFGGLQTMASYNKFKNNCYRDALIVAILNCCTSVFAGFVIFSVIGHMSVKTGNAVKDVAKQGAGLAFVAYPEGVAAMPGAPFWSFLFFFMLLTLGLDSQFAMMETVISGLVDEFPSLRKTKLRKFGIVGGLCIIFFLLGIPMCCKGGIYFFTLVDWYSASFPLMVTAFIEIVAINYVYGIKNFINDIKMMIGQRPGVYWIACWTVITPFAIVFIFLFSVIQFKGASYGDYLFPDWMNGLGWSMSLLSILAIPVFMVVELFNRGLFAVCKKAASPSLKWGPCVEKYWPEDPRYAEKLKRTQAPSEIDVVVSTADTPPPSYANTAFASSTEQFTQL